MTKITTRIGIIGAGSAGLTGLKTLLETFKRSDVDRYLDIVVYEQNKEVGGVWYDDGQVKKSKTVFESDSTARVEGNDDLSPMYTGLRTNLPYDLMSYRDHSFPEDTPTFPYAHQVQAYLESYANRFGLRRYIRFETPVTRLYKDGNEWVIESKSGSERYDKVLVANGHYAETFIPTIPGLSTFRGRVTHSRFYRDPTPYVGQTVLVVGSFASGSDLARLISSSNLVEGQEKRTKVYVSSETDPTAYASRDGEWAKYVHDIPLIQSMDGNKITFTDGRTVEDVDVVIFATGYRYSLPFCKASDEPWNSIPVLEDIMPSSEEGSWKSDGIRGFYMDNLDQLQLFLKTDSSIAFPALQYQVVPFPLAEAQARLISFHWSNLLPSLPSTPVPSNPSNPFSDKTAAGTDGKQRKVIKMRKDFVFGFPYEWTYEEHLMALCLNAEPSLDKVPEYWKGIEPWRRARRDDKQLRKKTLGY